MGLYDKLVDDIRNRARQNPKIIVFADANNFKVLKAVQAVMNEGIAKPILMGNEEEIQQLAKKNNIDLNGTPIVDIHSPEEEDRRKTVCPASVCQTAEKGHDL